MEKKMARTTFDNPFKVGDNVRVELEGMQKKSEGQFSNEIYSVVDVRGKRVYLNDGKVRKYDMLLKVSHVPEVRKPDIIKRAKQEYKQEKILEKEDQKQENIRETRTRGNRINYAELNKRGK